MPPEGKPKNEHPSTSPGALVPHCGASPLTHSCAPSYRSNPTLQCLGDSRPSRLGRSFCEARRKRESTSKMSVEGEGSGAPKLLLVDQVRVTGSNHSKLGITGNLAGALSREGGREGRENDGRLTCLLRSFAPRSRHMHLYIGLFIHLRNIFQGSNLCEVLYEALSTQK